jgi:anti-sigma-K factor RskA
MSDPSPDLTEPQLLAAHADGELDGAARRRAEEYLRQHPDAAGELAGQRALSPQNDRLWAVVEPPEPSESRWNAVRSGIERRLFPIAEPRRKRPRSRWLKQGLLLAALAVTSATAAAVVVATVPPRRHVPPVPGSSPRPFDDGGDVFAITQPDDVDIVSIRHADSQNLVIGQPPVVGPLVLTTQTDVQFDGARADRDGNMPVFQTGGPDDMPGALASPREP